MRRRIFASSVFPAILMTTFAIAGDPVSFDNPKGLYPAYLKQSEPIFARAHDLAVSPDGAFLLVADLGNNEIKILDPGKLTLLSQFGKDQLSSPHDIAFDLQGRALVADTENNRIMVYKFEGVFRDGSASIEHIDTWSDGISGPEGVAGGSEGRVYVGNTGSNSIIVLKDGKVIKSINSAGPDNTALSSPHDIHVDSKGRVIAVDSGNNRILVFDKDLNFTRELSRDVYGFNDPKYVASDDQGNILVADEDNHQIKIMDSAFKPLGRIVGVPKPAGPGPLKGPEGIETVGRYMWVSDTYNSRVLLYKRP